jgi:hypothetical protein
MVPYVFISYSREDRQFVERLKAGLNGAGIRTWTDLDDIPAGRDWAHAIDEGLNQATVLLYVASRRAQESKWMDHEYSAFVERSKRVIPIILDEEGPSRLPPALKHFQWVDFSGVFESALQKLLHGIGDVRGTTPLPAALPKSKGYVFISYADEDARFVADLKEFLKNQGYGYWDYRESQRNYQADYTLELEGVIKEAAGTLSVISPGWKRSPTALQELHFSREIGTPVFILKVQDPGPTLAISGLTYIDFMQDRERGFAQLDVEMRRKGL